MNRHSANRGLARTFHAPCVKCPPAGPLRPRAARPCGAAPMRAAGHTLSVPQEPISRRRRRGSACRPGLPARRIFPTLGTCEICGLACGGFLVRFYPACARPHRTEAGAPGVTPRDARRDAGCGIRAQGSPGKTDSPVNFGPAHKLAFVTGRSAGIGMRTQRPRWPGIGADGMWNHVV